MRRTYRRILITAGPTRERIDPVRYLTNFSTGVMGYAIAAEALRRGYRVTLISGPTGLKPPRGVRFIPVVSALDLSKACRRWFPKHDLLIMSAAVCDYSPAKISLQKIPRVKNMQLRLKATPDIVAGLARRKGRRLVIGFCLETKDWLGRAWLKMAKKNLDGIVANRIFPSDRPFGSKSVTMAFMNQRREITLCKHQTKKVIAGRLLKWIETLFEVRESKKSQSKK